MSRSDRGGYLFVPAKMTFFVSVATPPSVVSRHLPLKGGDWNPNLIFSGGNEVEL